MSDPENISEPFVFDARVSELNAANYREPRDLEKELFGKKGSQKFVDNIEQELGIKPKIDKHRIKFHNRVFSPADPDDGKLLDELYNDPRYAIVQTKDTWTAFGEYKMFVLYGEDLDFKPKEEENDEK